MPKPRPKTKPAPERRFELHTFRNTSDHFYVARLERRLTPVEEEWAHQFFGAIGNADAKFVEPSLPNSSAARLLDTLDTTDVVTLRPNLAGDAPPPASGPERKPPADTSPAAIEAGIERLQALITTEVPPAGEASPEAPAAAPAPESRLPSIEEHRKKHPLPQAIPAPEVTAADPAPPAAATPPAKSERDKAIDLVRAAPWYAAVLMMLGIAGGVSVILFLATVQILRPPTDRIISSFQHTGVPVQHDTE